MKPTLVTVKWRDATFYDKCFDLEKCERKLELESVVTTGYFVKQDDDFVAVAMGYDGSDAYWDIICIPWGMIDEWYEMTG